MDIVVATQNEGKLQEVKDLLREIGANIISLKDIPQLPVICESGLTFHENALIKAESIASFTKMITIADDSGLEVDSLDGKPGVYSARFAAENASDEENNKKLLRELDGVPISKRGATFRCVIAIVNPNGKKGTVEGECRGIIQFRAKGEFGFGYDPLFLIPEYGKTLAELPIEIKNKISHRADAIKKLKAVFEKYI
ncbi:MAG: XTP/dITP diphosphatase [Thermodesulfobacteriota bacterium]|nr:XTP/dITP diphosphatase [Thermodesulfobacteriota bacterium]